jgi:hypothetical protein
MPSLARIGGRAQAVKCDTCMTNLQLGDQVFVGQNDAVAFGETFGVLLDRLFF